jgi:hypothetical protein
LNHFGAGDIPFSATDHDTLSAAAAFIQVPFVAKIFNRDITRWNDAEIKALNPGFDLDQPITVAHRVKGSSSTKLATTYLNAKCESVWTADMVGSTIDWQPDTVAAEGSGGISSYLAANPYSISYIDSGHGIASGLGEISLKNANGKFVRSSTDGAIAAAATAASGTDRDAALYTYSWDAVTLMDQAGDESWPICTFSYLYIRKDMSGYVGTGEPETAALVKAFAQFVLSVEAQEMLPDFGFVGIPTAILEQARIAVNNINIGDATAWIFEKDTNDGLNMLNGKTDASDVIDGMATNVFSAKRMAYADYERSVMVKSIAELEAKLVLMQIQHAALHPNAWYEDPKTQIEGAAAVGALGFILGFIGLVLGAVSLTRINGLQKSSSGGYAI